MRVSPLDGCRWLVLPLRVVFVCAMSDVLGESSSFSGRSRHHASHLLMPQISVSDDGRAWHTERSASQPLSPLPPSPLAFPPSPDTSSQLLLHQQQQAQQDSQAACDERQARQQQQPQQQTPCSSPAPSSSASTSPPSLSSSPPAPLSPPSSAAPIVPVFSLNPVHRSSSIDGGVVSATEFQLLRPPAAVPSYAAPTPPPPPPAAVPPPFRSLEMPLHGNNGHNDPHGGDEKEQRSLFSYAAAMQPMPTPPPSLRSFSHRPMTLWPSLSASSLPPIAVLSSLSFNCLDLSEDQLLVFTLHSLAHLDLVSALQLSLPHLQTFLLTIRSHYRHNPYHNFYHGFAVFQFGFLMLTTSRLQALLSPFDQLALLIACLCHDVDHPGTTNGFQIAVDSGLARVHNEVAVLENHHAFVTCEMLRHPQANFLSAFSVLQLRQFRKLVIAAILATDMAVHFDLCRQFARLDPDLARYDSAKEEDRQLVLNLVTHSSDLSAQVMDFGIASLWESRVTAEFIAQSELEAQLGLPVSPFMRGLQEHNIRYKNHLNFLDLVMEPLWNVVADVLPALTPAVHSLSRNRSAYEHRLGHPPPAAQQQRAADDEQQPLQPNPVAASSSSATSTAPSSLPVSVVVTPSASSPQSPTGAGVQSPQASSPHSAHDLSSPSPSPLSRSPNVQYHALMEDGEAQLPLEEEEDGLLQDKKDDRREAAADSSRDEDGDQR